jgi:hypothetical protein
MIMSVLLVMTAFAASSNMVFAQPLSDYDKWQSGYDHGCSDGRTGGHPYLNSHPTHTEMFMIGYNDGYNIGSTIGCDGEGPPGKILEDFMPCLWPDCYYPTDDINVGEDDNCRLPNCFLDLAD